MKIGSMSLWPEEDGVSLRTASKYKAKHNLIDDSWFRSEQEWGGMEQGVQLAMIVKKTKLKASSLILVTYIQLHAGFEVQLEL